MIELRSDTFTLPTSAMMEAIAAAPLGDDVYGEDPTVRKLEELSAEKLGKQAACLLPSGTMANLTAIMAHCPRGAKLLVGNESDMYIYEAGGASVCAGVIYEPIATQRDGRLLISDLEKVFPDEPEDPQFALPALISVENTHNRCGGLPLPIPYLEEIAAFAKARGIPVHMDGARLFNAAVAQAVRPALIARHVDSVQFCLSKGLSAPVGSIVAGDPAFIERVRRARKMLGGGMRQAGIIAAAGVVALEQMVDRLAEDHHNARRLAEKLAQIPGVEIDPDQVQTNIVFFRVIDPRFTWQTFIASTRRYGLAIGELGHGRIRAVTHWGITTREIDAALSIITRVLREGPQV